MQELRSFIRSRQPANLAVVLANVAVFVVLCFLGDTEDARFMAEHGASFAPFVIEGKEYYRLVTCMFLHFGIEHLFYNMLVLIFLGDVLEKEAGRLRYLLIYFAGGVAGNVISVCLDYRTKDFAVSAGASGAIFAVTGALLWIVIRNRGRLENYSGRRLFLMAALSVAEGFTTQGIDNRAHVGGLLAGFLLAVMFYRKENGSRRQKSV